MTDRSSTDDSIQVLAELVRIPGCAFAIVFTSDGILRACDGIGQFDAAAYTASCCGQFRRDPALVSVFGPDAPAELCGMPSRHRTFLRSARPDSEDRPAWCLLVKAGAIVDGQAIDRLIGDWATMISGQTDNPGNLKRPPPKPPEPPVPRCKERHSAGDFR